MFHESCPTHHPLQAGAVRPMLRSSAMARLRLERLNGAIQGTDLVFDVVQELQMTSVPNSTLCSSRIMSRALVETCKLVIGRNIVHSLQGLCLTLTAGFVCKSFQLALSPAPPSTIPTLNRRLQLNIPVQCHCKMEKMELRATSGRGAG
jgi:hypothetical protein